MVLEYILLAVLLVCAVVIVVAVTMQKSNEGLSGTISGSSETYYGKDKGAKNGKRIFTITLITALVFAVAVLAVYVLQPDYTNASNEWKQLSEYYYDVFQTT